jgi:hypothetical protein
MFVRPLRRRSPKLTRSLDARKGIHEHVGYVEVCRIIDVEDDDELPPQPLLS